eukprot:GHVU01171401.1.p3 GENE.GHVU01171401.1~~GHVU01171401.1.p3  ORF type:complete len:111 (-),score=7.58 GHVU01171401.1:129-461(-)
MYCCCRRADAAVLLHQQEKQSFDLTEFVQRPPTYLVDHDPSRTKVVVVVDGPHGVATPGDSYNYDPDTCVGGCPPVWTQEDPTDSIPGVRGENTKHRVIKHYTNRRKWCR